MIRNMIKESSICIMLLCLVSAPSIEAFTASHAVRSSQVLYGSSTSESSVATAVDKAAKDDAAPEKDPLLIRAARGEANIERTPVWMMRQAGRHIQAYRDLCKEYPTFRQRSEITEVAVEVSLQPWRNYQTDGCILFSDILTPLPGMGCDFVIDEAKGPIMTQAIRTQEDLKLVCHISLCQATFACRLSLSLSHSSFWNSLSVTRIRPTQVDTLCERSLARTAQGCQSHRYRCTRIRRLSLHLGHVPCRRQILQRVPHH